MATAILFDMDGVIVDSNRFHRPAWKEFCKHHSCDVDDAFFNMYISGKTNEDACRAVFGTSKPKEELLRLSKEKEELFRKELTPHLKPVNGLLDFLEHASKRYKLAVATSAPIENVDFILNGLDIRHYFQALVYEADVIKGKPDPEVYLKAAEKIGESPKNCIVIEDSMAGVQSGLSAGMRVIGITTTHSKAELLEKGVSLVIDDFVGLDQKISTLFAALT